MRKAVMDNLRIQFLPGEQKDFLQKVIDNSGLSSKELAALAKVHPRSFLDWRREKLRMTLFALTLFSHKFSITLPESLESMKKRWKESVSSAARIGGGARFKKYGLFATEVGRRKGGRKALQFLRNKGLIPDRKFYNHPTKSVLLAEFVGIMLGDGGITPAQCAITLNSEADAMYIPFVANLGNQLFGFAPGIYKRTTEKATIIYYNGIDLTEYFMRIGLKIGNKVKQQVGIPKWVLSKREYELACLRGLMDTDGGAFFHEYKVNGKSYKYLKIGFTNKSIPLIKFVFNTLYQLDLSPKLRDELAIKKVWLYNSKKVERYFQLVGSHNERLLKNIREASHSLVH